jgi:hypothetical protein
MQLLKKLQAAYKGTKMKTSETTIYITYILDRFNSICYFEKPWCAFPNDQHIRSFL